MFGLDAYAEPRGIEAINLLKTDTQGFDRQVMDGAMGLIERTKVQLILAEVMFIEFYQGQPLAPEYLKHIFGLGYRLVGFYDYGYRDDAAAWCDTLFVNPAFEP